MKILLVEDEEDLRNIVKRYLEKSKYLVDVAGDGKKALEMSNITSYDLLILDLNLPIIDGIEVSKRLRMRGSDVPIIMLTARSQVYNKLEGFDVGADDYITKPFDMKELLARITAVLKRGRKNLIVLKFNEYDVFPRKNILKKGNEVVELSTKEMGILEYLLLNKGVPVSTEELLEHVWDTEIDMLTDTVKTHIKTLRKKVDPNKKYILNIRGKGYLYKG